MFGNLKIPMEIEETVIKCIKSHKYNGYGPSVGKVYFGCLKKSKKKDKIRNGSL